MATGLLLVLVCVGAAVADVEHSHGGEKHKEVPRHEHFPDGEHDSGYDHDSILGSHKLEEEFSHLAPEEAKKRLRLLVAKMDTNGDGSISRPELEDWVLDSFKKLDQEEATERFAEYDTTGDGRIDWPGYLQKVYGMDEQEIQEMDRSEETEAFLDMTVDDKAKFNAADVNQDGYLDVKEFVAFEYPYDFPNMYEVELDRTYRDLDKDKDSKLTFKEFLGDVEMVADEKAAQEEEFKQYDKDGDDFLSRSETLPWILPDNKQASADEAEHLISQTDTNHDGILSPDEIAEQHELWVGSQATNYGKHLQDEL